MPAAKVAALDRIAPASFSCLIGGRFQTIYKLFSHWFDPQTDVASVSEVHQYAASTSQLTVEAVDEFNRTCDRKKWHFRLQKLCFTRKWIWEICEGT